MANQPDSAGHRGPLPVPEALRRRTKTFIDLFTDRLARGVAGAALAIDLGIFQQNLTNAQGFIAIALVYFGAWRPLGVMAGSLLYGFVNAINVQWKKSITITDSGSPRRRPLYHIWLVALVLRVSLENSRHDQSVDGLLHVP